MMYKVRFNFKGEETIIQCNNDEKMEEICKRYVQIIKQDIDKLIFIYSGNIIDEELKYEEQVNEEDKIRNEINILVYEKYKTIINKKKLLLKEIICPICQENIFMKINDYQINLSKCKNGHNNNILLKEFYNIQNIDNSKIICEICKTNNKNNTYNNDFYKCYNCNINLCPLCKSTHDKNHNIINYDKRNFLCNKHNDNFIKYCKSCNENICKICEKEHNTHNIINFSSILPNKDIKNNINGTKIYIDKLNNEINEIINKLKNIKENLELYYNISSSNILNNIDEFNNYQKLYNINEFINFNNIIIKDIKEVINSKDIKIKFKHIFNIYEKMNKCDNYIIAEIYIKEEDINRDIKIISSFEQFKRESNTKNVEVDEYCKFGNEKEIKENCKIKINNEIIPFSYYYKFEKKGKNIIQYSFINKLKKTDFMFDGCESISTIDLSNFYTQNIINMTCMFANCKTLINIYLSYFNTQNVTSMSGMFQYCNTLININLSNFNTQNVTSMSGMFYGCTSLKYLNLSNFNTQNVTNMNSMFNECRSLTNVNLSNFNTQNVTNMGNMFFGCESLTNIDLSNFNTQNVDYMTNMFYRCTSLKYLNLSNFDTQNTKNMSSIFYGCESLKRNNIIAKDYKILNNAKI